MWRLGRLQSRLEDLPLELLLRHQFRSMEEIEEANLERTGSLPVLRLLKRRTKKLIWSASKRLALRPLRWLSRLRSLQPFRVRLVQARRRLLLGALLLVVRILRRSLGSQRP